MKFVFCFFMAVVWFVMSIAAEDGGTALIISQIWLVGGMVIND